MTGPGGRNTLHSRPATIPGSVRQDLVLEVDGEEDDEGTRKREPHEQQRGRAKHLPVQQEDGARQGFDDRIPDGDRRTTIAAPAPEGEVARDGNVVGPGQRVRARRAARRGKDNRRAGRQAMDADVQETADAQAAQRQRDFRESGREHHQRGA